MPSPVHEQPPAAPARRAWRAATPAIGPVFVGLGVWCAAGALTAADAGEAAIRVAAPASLWWLACGALVAGLVPAWRRSPGLATPALLTLIPWLPLPIPAVTLLWTGALAWVPLALAAVGASYATVRSREPANSSSMSERWRQSATIAGLLTFIASGVVLWSIHPRLPGGDEPHYLIITQSLRLDGDLRIENNHQARDYASYWGGNLAPDYLQRGRDGEIYSIHAPGVSVLVAPMFATFGLLGAQLTIMACAAATGSLIWIAGCLAGRSRGAAWFAWAAVVGSTTFLVQSVMIFPDMPGAFVTAAATVLWLRLASGPRVKARWLVLVSGLLAALPFLHTRFVVLAAGFGVALLLRLWQDNQLVIADRARRLLAFLAIPTVGALGWFAYFQIIYGTPNPVAAYGANPETSLTYVPGGVAGLLFDQQFGLFIYTPALMLALLAWCWPSRYAQGPRLTALAVIALVYAATVATYWMWWAGVPATPARFLTSALPLLAAPTAAVWSRLPTAGRASAFVLLAVSLGMSAWLLSVGDGALAWNTRGAYAAWLTQLNAVVDLSRAWPSFFWRLTPGVVRSEGAFAAHVVVWIATFLAGAAIVRLAVRRKLASDVSTAPIVWGIWWFPAALMAAASLGWWMDGSTIVNPARSQLSLLRRGADGAALVTIAPLRVRAIPEGQWPVRMTIPRTDLPGAAAAEWAAITNVPRGVYELRILFRRPSGGVLTVRVGESPQPVATFDLPRISEQTMALDLRGGASRLRFLPNETLAAAVRSLELVPQVLAPAAAGAAHAVVSGIDIDAFMLDDEAYLEERAFWVRGQRAARVILSTRSSGRTQTVVRLVNGPRPNTVTVTSEQGAERFEMAASEARDVVASLTSHGTTTLTIASAAGFRPSDDGQSQDSRYLGVRVEIEP